MRTLPAVVVAMALVLAGCSTGFQSTPGAETTPEPSGTDAPADTPEPATPMRTSTPSSATDGPPDSSFDFADPPEDRLGWEAGVWHNESLDITPEDGLNSTELNATVARAIARVELIRQEEFTEPVPVTVINRSTYRSDFIRANTNYSEAFRSFDNAKFEALFLIGEDRGSLAVQNANRGSSVLGFYSPREDEIVVVSESETPTLNTEFTLAHELVHALQDQRFNLTEYRATTRDAANGQSGVIEGEANLVEDRYRQRCEAEWECLNVSTDGSSAPGNLHLGVYFVNFFPYTDGPGFVESRYEQGGWTAVDELYANVPASSEQVIYPERYGADEPVEVGLEDTNSGGWERLRPDAPRPNGVRPDYATLGQSALSSMFAYTLYDEYNESRVVGPREWLNVDADGEVNRSDPLNYGLSVTDGWDGDRLHVYANPDAGPNETAYVWRIVWDDASEAEEFVESYRALLAHWGGDRVSGSPNHWRIDSGPFEDSFYIDAEGDTVTIVNAPSEGELGEVYEGYTPPS